MPVFQPFNAIHYPSGSDFQAVLAPPYDVLSDADVDQLAAKDEHNIVRIDVPRGGDERYRVAAQTLSSWLDAGVLVQDDVPSFTIYRMKFVDATGAERALSGVLGGLEVVDEGAGGVLPHERTTPKAKTDRLDLTRATATNMSPVWGLSPARGLTAELASPGEFLGTVTTEGVEHSFEQVTDPERIGRISRLVGSDDVLIADGHHRYAISRTYRDQVREATGRRDTAAEQTLTFVNELTADQLAIDAIHRLYTGIDFDQLRADLSGTFDLAPAPAASSDLLGQMVERGRLVLLGPGGSVQWLVPRPGAFDGVREIDGAWLEHALADSQAEPSYQHGLDEVLDAVASGRVAGAVLIRPTSLTEIMRTAREGLLMPPKSTFFTPKLRTGIMIRPTQALPS